MALTDDELRHLERLAALRLSDESREKFREQLSDIIDFIRKLQEIDTTGYSSRYSVTMESQYLQEDEARECLPREDVLETAPERENGFFRVPPVIEGEEL